MTDRKKERSRNMKKTKEVEDKDEKAEEED